MRSPDHPLYCLTRIAVGEQNRGWQFRTRRRGREISRFFSESVWGEEGALRRAQAYRDKTLRQNPQLPPDERAKTPRRKHRQTDIKVGVYVTKKKVKGGAGYHRYWTACWTTESGEPRFKKFSVNKYGYQAAKARAIAAREAGLSMSRVSSSSFT